MDLQRIDPDLFARRIEPDGCRWLKWTLLAALFALSYALFYQLSLRPACDISIHATWASECTLTDLTTFVRHGAHPLWHALVYVLLVCGMPLAHAAALITTLSKVAEVWLIHRLFTLYLRERVSPAAITVLSFVCAFVACLWVPWYNPTVQYGVGTPNTWHSCTQLIAMVFMLLCVPYTAYCYEHFLALSRDEGDKTVLPWREPLLLGGLLFLSLLAKPTFMQAFLPAACLFFLVQWVRRPQNSRFFWQMIACVLPAVVFMLFQYMYYFGIIVPSQGDMVLELSLNKFVRIGVNTLLIQAFPIYVLATHWREGKKDAFFWLTLWFDVVGVVEFLILGENGRRAADGNFGWGMMGAALMMWVVAMIWFFRSKDRLRRAQGGLSLRRAGGYGLLLWHLLSGVYYVIYLFGTEGVL